MAFAEVMHTALAYFQAGRAEAGYKLMKSSVLDGMYLGDSPGNFGQISFYDAARGECYRDFGDPIGVASRLLVQGLFGILPDAMNGRILIRPGFPMDWEKAALSTPDITYSFRRKGMKDTYKIEQHFTTPLAITLQVNALRENIESVKVNGQSVKWEFIESASGHPVIAVMTPVIVRNAVIEIVWGGDALCSVFEGGSELLPNQDLSLPALKGVVLNKLYDPQGVFTTSSIDKSVLKGKVSGQSGYHTFFVHVQQGQMQWWQPVDVENIKQEDVSVCLHLPG